MRKLSLFIAVFFSVFLINIGVSRSHVEPEDPFGGPFIECEELFLGGGVVEEYHVDFNVCYEEDLWETVDDIKNNKMTLSYHNTLRNANEEVILPDSEMNSMYLDTLAAAYAESGKFEDAVKTQEKGLNYLIRSSADKSAIEEFKVRLSSYKNKKPWRSVFIGN